jgi:IgGFc binding protein
MRRARFSFGAFGAAISVVVVALIAACGDDRGGFLQNDRAFETQPEAGAPDAETCFRQCSLDGRSIIDSCTGGVLETCADDLACGAATCQEPCAAAEADRSSNGCDFYFTKPRDLRPFISSCFATFVVNASNKPATVSLELRGEELDVSGALFRAVPNSTDLEPLQGPIPPGESAILFVADWDPKKPRTAAERSQHSACPMAAKPALEADFAALASGIGDAFRLKSNVPVGVTWMYPYGGAGTHFPTATLVLPVSAWAKEHVVVNGWEAMGTGVPVTQIFAAEDETEVTILGTKDVSSGDGFTGAAAGMPAKIMLSKGQYAQITQGEELTGSFVFSDKPTVTVGGHECTNLPSKSPACDSLAQQIPAFEQWGSEYVGVGYRPRTANPDEEVWYRMVGGRDGTELEYDPVKPPGAPLKLEAGELVLFRARSNDAFVVRSRDAEHPFYLGMHMTGGSGGPESPRYGDMGDPEFVNVVPSGQYMSAYSFYADSTYSEHSLVLVRKRTHGDFKDVWLECAGDLPDWKPIDDAGQYEYRRIDLSRRFGPGDSFGDKQCRTGLQRMRSEGAFSATLWGWGLAASYAYPGGMAFRKLVEIPLSTVH